MTFDFAEPLAPGQPDPQFDAPVPAHAADLLVGRAPDLMAARSEAPRGKHSSGWEPTAYVAPVPAPVAYLADAATVPEPFAYVAPVAEPFAYAAPVAEPFAFVAPVLEPFADAAPEPFAYVAPVPDPIAYAAPVPDPIAFAAPVPEPFADAAPEPIAFAAPVPEPIAFVVPEPFAFAAPVPEPFAFAEPEPVLTVLVGKHAAPRVEEVAPEPAYLAPVATTGPDPFAIAPTSWEPAAVAEEAAAPGGETDVEMVDRPAGRRIAVVPVAEPALFAAEPSNYPGDPGYVGDLGVPVLDLTPMPARDEPSGLEPTDLAASYDDGLSITPDDEWAAEQDATLSNLPGGLVDTRRHVGHEDAPAGRRRSGTGRRAEARAPRPHPVLFGVFGLLVGVAISASLLLLVGPLLITLA